MSASGTVELLATSGGVIEVARIYLGVELTKKQAARCTLKSKAPRGWMAATNATSSGPVAYLKGRIMRLKDSPFKQIAEDESLPLVFSKKRHVEYLDLCPIARSKMFRTPLVVFPIDLTACRVAGL